MSDKRIEKDSIGEIEVPANKYWGAQTQRSLIHFSNGKDLMPIEVVHALAIVKKAAAKANNALGKLDDKRMNLIISAADEVISGKLDEHFPLRVWMTGSGTQSNMNVNEVLSNRAAEMAGSTLGSKDPIHPNDHVNMSQSTNDAFPTAMHIAAAQAVNDRLLSGVKQLEQSLTAKADEWKDIVKIGRTHMQDAVPITLGQEFSGYASMLKDNIKRIQGALDDVYKLALGGTAVGTGLNAPKGFAKKAIAEITSITGLPFVPAPNLFAAQGAHDALVMLSATIKTLANSLYKIANDIMIMSCGPRAGLDELLIPANEPGSSIMPGKINPTQCEAMAMAAVQVMGYDAAVAFAGASGNLELNVYKPLIIFNIIQSITILSGCCVNFSRYMVDGIKPNLKRIDIHLRQSLMLVTALTPHIGYDKAAEVAKYAFDHDVTLKDAALKLGYVSEKNFEKIVDPYKMAHPHGQ